MVTCTLLASEIGHRALTNRVKTSWLFVSFGAQGMGLLPATLGLGSNRTHRGLLRHLRPLYPAPVAWHRSQLASPRHQN